MTGSNANTQNNPRQRPGPDAPFCSARAADDLDDIAEYIARDNPQRASSFIDELQERCEKFADLPAAASLHPGIAEGIRIVPFGRYLILYSIGSDRVLIERILHGERDIPESFGGTA